MLKIDNFKTTPRTAAINQDLDIMPQPVKKQKLIQYRELTSPPKQRISTHLNQVNIGSIGQEVKFNQLKQQQFEVEVQVSCKRKLLINKPKKKQIQHINIESIHTELPRMSATDSKETIKNPLERESAGPLKQFRTQPFNQK